MRIQKSTMIYSRAGQYWLLLAGVHLGINLAIHLIAPIVIFSHVGVGVSDSGAAGTISGAMFEVYRIISWFAYPIMIYLLMSEFRCKKGKRLKSALVFLLLATMLFLFESLYIIPEIQSIKATLSSAYGSMSQVPDGQPEKEWFGFLHGASMLRSLGELAFTYLSLYFGSIGLLENRRA